MGCVDKWFEVKKWGNEWSGMTLYVNPAIEKAKVYKYEVSCWGYHDESEWNEKKEIISIEEAIAMAYPDETALSAILDIVDKDYKNFIEQLRTSREK